VYAESLGDCVSAPPLPCAFNSRTRATSIEAGRPFPVNAVRLGQPDAFHLELAPEIGLELGKTPSMSRKHLPAAVLVSLGRLEGDAALSKVVDTVL